MDGRVGKPPPTPRAAPFSWDFNIDLSCLLTLWLGGWGGGGGERGRQVRLSMCVFNNRSNREKRRRAGRGTDESAGRADRVWKGLLEMTATLYLHLCTSWWSASTSPSLCVLHTHTTETTTGGHCAEQCRLNCQTVSNPTFRSTERKCKRFLGLAEKFKTRVNNVMRFFSLSWLNAALKAIV